MKRERGVWGGGRGFILGEKKAIHDLTVHSVNYAQDINSIMFTPFFTEHFYNHSFGRILSTATSEYNNLSSINSFQSYRCK